MIEKALFALTFAYPVWLGIGARPISQAALFAAVLTVMLFFFGPKQADVQGSPSKLAMFIMGAFLAAGGTALAYGLGYLLA